MVQPAIQTNANDSQPFAAEPPVRVIRARTGWAPLELGALWRHRELLGFFALRDIRLRYQQTQLGAAWAIAQPLSTALVFAVFLGHLGGIPSDGVPYVAFAFAGLVPWQLFAHAMLQSSNSLVDNRAILSKVELRRTASSARRTARGSRSRALGFAYLTDALPRTWAVSRNGLIWPYPGAAPSWPGPKRPPLQVEVSAPGAADFRAERGATKERAGCPRLRSNESCAKRPS